MCDLKHMNKKNTQNLLKSQIFLFFSETLSMSKLDNCFLTKLLERREILINFVFIYIYNIYIYIYISTYKWINHEQSARQQGAIYKFDWEGI